MSIRQRIQKIRKKNEYLSQEEALELEANSSSNTVEEIIGEVGDSISRPAPKIALKLILGILLITSIAMFITGVIRYGQLMERRDMLQKEVEELDYEIEELQYYLGISNDDNEYIIRVARKKLNLHFPDEIVYYNNTNE